MQLIVIDKLEDLKNLRAYIKNLDFIAYDCETTGVHKGAEIIGYSICGEENKAFYVILSYWNKEQTKLVYCDEEFRKLAAEIVSDLKGHKLIMHNSVFDCIMANSFFKIDLMPSLHTDTMILAHLVDENRRVGLKELSSNIFGEDSAQEQKEMKQSVLANGGKLTKSQYEMYKADPYIMGKYGAKDALLTYKLFLYLVPQLFKQNLDKFFYEEESMPLLKGPTYQLNSTGLKVDSSSMTVLKKTLEAECLEAKAFIYHEIASHIKERYPGTNKSNTFNIGASQQLSWLLFGQLSLEFSTLTDSGKMVCKELGLKLPYTPSAKRDFIVKCEHMKGKEYKPSAIINGKKQTAKKIKDPWSYIACDKKVLAKLAPKYKWIQKLIEYQRKMKILGTYINGIESKVQYGVIYPSFLQHGTSSGRYSSRNPNFQNLPRDDKRIKECIVARPGKVFVGADYSQLEPRVFAFFSKDERLLKAFNGTDDFYSVIGMEVYDKYDCVPRKEGENAFGVKYKKLRDLSKVIALASTYGATAHQLAPTTGKSIEETQNDIDSYFEKFPGVAQMMLDSHELAKNNGYVTSLFNRPRRMPEAKKIVKLYGNKAHADLPYEVRNMLNLAVNHRIQSTGASIVNRAAIKFNNNCNDLEIPFRIVLQVHDSIVVECNESDAQNISLLLQDAMENTVQLEGIRLEAVPKIGRNLAEV